MTYFTTGVQLQAALNALPGTKTGNFVAFDSSFYSQQYMGAYQGTLSALEHFVQIGASLGFKPNATFDPVYYKNAYADLKNTDFNAADLLYHFMQYGLDEGRTPNAELATFSGAAYLVAQAIKKSRVVAFAELGMEAIYEFDVKDMPVTVAVDSKGESVHITGPAIWQKKISESLAVEVQ